MFRLSKIADYGIIILAHLAQRSGGHDSSASDAGGPSLNARELALHVDLPLPVVSKVLKTLTRAGVLVSHRGAKGGYTLARRPEDLSVAEMITALDGPLALTQCGLGPSVCDLELSCAVKTPWLVINRVVHDALAGVTLADLTDPRFATQHAPLAGLAQLGRGHVHAGDLGHVHAADLGHVRTAEVGHVRTAEVGHVRTADVGRVRTAAVDADEGI